MEKKSDAEPADLIRRAFAMPGSIFPLNRITRRIVAVDEDIDISNLEDVEWAIWTRVADASRLIVISDAESWELDRVSETGRGSLRLGIDATMGMAHRDKLIRPRTPGFENIRLEDYVPAGGAESSGAGNVSEKT